MIKWLFNVLTTYALLKNIYKKAQEDKPTPAEQEKPAKEENE